MLVRAGIVTTRVSNMTLICFDFCTNLKIRDILRALMKVVDAPKSNFIVMDIILVTMVRITIIKSKIFPDSLKYALNPKLISFKTASKAKTTAKP
jgi:hypothetical protein